MGKAEISDNVLSARADEVGEGEGVGEFKPMEQNSEMHDDTEFDDDKSEQQIEDDKAASKKKKKKKSKKGKKQQSNLEVMQSLPSQPLVEANFPWKTVVKPKRGRCAVATRALKAGEVVVAERALTFIPREEYHASVCHSCCTFLEDTDAKASCSGCAFVVFCQKCKKTAMKAHQRRCQVMRAIPSIAERNDCDTGLLRLMINLAQAMVDFDNNPEAGLGVFQEGAIWPSIQDALGLKAHVEHMPAGWRQSVRKACQNLQEAAALMRGLQPESNPQEGSENGFTLPAGNGRGGDAAEEGQLETLIQKDVTHSTFVIESLEHLAALINTNAHGMGAHGPKNTDVALGIFPFVSLLNHSCRPNCTFASEGNVMYVRATQDVPEGAELCVTYINLYEPRGVRQETLLASKHFLCSCDRCTEPIRTSVDRFLEGVLCSARGCKGVLLRATAVSPQPPSPSSWVCDLCSRIVDPAVSIYPLSTQQAGKGSGGCDSPWEVVAQAEKHLTLALVPYRERRFKEARAALEKLFSDFSGKLHPLHVVLFDARTPLMNCCRTAGDAAEGIRQAQAVVEALETVVPGQILEQANFYACLGEMCAERAASVGSPTLARRLKKQAQEMLQKVAAIRQICLGRA